MLKRLFTNWSGFDTITGIFIGVVITMPIVMYAEGMHGMTMKFLTVWKGEIVDVFLVTFVLGRLFAIARFPRHEKLDRGKMTWPGFWSAHFLSAVLAIVLFIIILARMAPGVLELIAKHLGD